MFVFWIIVLLFDFPTWNINTLIEAPSPRTGHGALLQFFVRASESNRETMKSSNLTSSSSLFFRVCHSGCVRSAWASSGCSIIAPPPGQCFSFVQQRLYIWDGCSLWAPPIQLIAELSWSLSSANTSLITKPREENSTQWRLIGQLLSHVGSSWPFCLRVLSGGFAARPKSVVRFTASSTETSGAQPAAGRKPASASSTEAMGGGGKTGRKNRGWTLLVDVFFLCFYIWNQKRSQTRAMNIWQLWSSFTRLRHFQLSALRLKEHFTVSAAHSSCSHLSVNKTLWLYWSNYTLRSVY